jgi:hypothetical protein
MKKRFATFLFTGKIAALPLLSHADADSMQNMFPKSSRFIENQQARLHGIMDLVITDLHDRDEVLVVVSPEKNSAELLELNRKLYGGLYESRIVNHFTVIDTLSALRAGSSGLNQENPDAKKTLRAMSLPVELDSISAMAKNGRKIYLHILVAPDSKWDKSITRSSDVLELKSADKTKLLSFYGDDTEDCTPYTCY